MTEEKKGYSPSEVADLIKGKLEKDPQLSSIPVEGEICNYTLASSGHHYFSLKDSGSVLPCILFKRDCPSGLLLENGCKVLVMGSITVFVQRGVYQMRCTKVHLLGAGDLHQQFLMLKNKLEQQGLFHQSHKKPLPSFPKSVALITSLSGAVVWDMIKILKARSPITKILVIPVNVQGEGVEHQMAGAVAWADFYRVADVFIIGRGGGSQEDLRPFNTEVLAHSIYHCHTPIISAVGHEPDVSISDYVADVRAATPTHAAELAVPVVAQMQQQLSLLQEQMVFALEQRIGYHRSQLEVFSNAQGFRDPHHHLREKAQMIDYWEERLVQSMESILQQARNHCGQLSASLHALSPLEVMGRGYAIPRSQDGRLLHKAKDVEIGEKISLTLSDGTLHCVTECIETT